MKTSFTIALAVLVGTGAGMAACGSSGGSSGSTAGHGGSGTSTSTSSGHGGAASSTSSGAGGDTGFDGGFADVTAADSDACGNVTLMTQVVPGNIIVVFDQSDSMNQPYKDADGGAGDGGVSGPKWQVARDAILAALTPDEPLLNVGAIFFPTAATCTVAPITMAPQIPIEPGATFVSDFKTHFTGSWKLILGTPTKVALDNTNMALPDPSPLKGQRAVVLITDGAPTCDTVQADILAPVQAMAMRGINTYVIGLPGSANAANLLNAIASAGGTGMYRSPSDPTELQDQLAMIASSTLDKCTIDLNPPPSDPSLVHMVVTDMKHPNGYEIPEGVDGGSGWTLSPDGKTAKLVGSVCTTAKDGGYTTIQFVYGCPTLN